MLINLLLVTAKIIGSKALLNLTFKALDEIAKKTDNKIDDEIVESVKIILIQNFNEKKELKCRK